jgi:hypothetical protein
MPRRVPTRPLALLALLLAAPAAPGQVTLTSTGSYFQDFNSIGSGLPTGWTVRINATNTALGMNVSTTNYNQFATSWGTSTGQFANYASALNPGANGTQTSTTQAAYTDRALGVRQDTQDFGDPGAAFTLQLANTAGFQDFNLSFSAQLLSVQPRDTVYTVRYGLGTNPSSFTNLATINTGTLNGGVFGEDSFTLGPSDLAGINNVNTPVWIQIVALSASTGSGSSRDTFAIDNFQLTYSPVPEPGAMLAVAAGGLGLFSLGRRRRRAGG